MFDSNLVQNNFIYQTGGSMQQPRQYTPLGLMVIIYLRTMYTRSKSRRCKCKSVQRHIKSRIERKRSKHSSCALFSVSLMLVEMTVWDDSRVELYSIHQRVCVLSVLFTNAMFVSESLSSLCSIQQRSFSFLSAEYFFSLATFRRSSRYWEPNWHLNRALMVTKLQQQSRNGSRSGKGLHYRRCDGAPTSLIHSYRWRRNHSDRAAPSGSPSCSPSPPPPTPAARRASVAGCGWSIVLDLVGMLGWYERA
jgi:hypothetical protein